MRRRFFHDRVERVGRQRRGQPAPVQKTRALFNGFATELKRTSNGRPTHTRRGTSRARREQLPELRRALIALGAVGVVGGSREIVLAVREAVHLRACVLARARAREGERPWREGTEDRRGRGVRALRTRSGPRIRARRRVPRPSLRALRERGVKLPHLASPEYIYDSAKRPSTHLSHASPREFLAERGRRAERARALGRGVHVRLGEQHDAHPLGPPSPARFKKKTNCWFSELSRQV